MKIFCGPGLSPRMGRELDFRDRVNFPQGRSTHVLLAPRRITHMSAIKKELTRDPHVNRMLHDVSSGGRLLPLQETIPNKFPGGTTELSQVRGIDELLGVHRDLDDEATVPI